MAIIRFATNVPVLVHMKSTAGRGVESQFGGIQTVYTASEGIFYVSEKVGEILQEQFGKLAVEPGDAIEITKAETGKGPERRTQWVVTRPVGEQGDGTFSVPAPPANGNGAGTSHELKPAPQHQQLNTSTAAPSITSRWAAEIIEQTKVKLDIYHELCIWAKANLEGITRNEVRAILMNVMISSERNGVRR